MSTSISTVLPLSYSPEIDAAIRAHGERVYPNECCGVLYGRESAGVRVVEAIEEVENGFEAGEQFHRFSITPQVLMGAEKRAGRDGRLVLGFYHSHPDHPAKPSEYDRVHAWPFYSYIIVAIGKGKSGDLTSWQLMEDTEQFASQEIRIISEKEKETTMSLKEVEAKGYSHPGTLVTTEWVAAHGSDANVRLVEVDIDTTSYDKGHIKNAIGWHWQNDLQDRRVRDLLDPRSFAELLRRSGISPEHTVVIYGDNNNWFAAWALWQLKYYGHKDVRLMDGGRKKWELEKRELVTEVPTFSRTEYPIPATDESIRAYRRQVEDVYTTGKVNLVDVRSPDEFTGKLLAPPGLPETCQRGGHIPNAKNVPWAKAVKEDGSFKPADELRALYGGVGVDFGKPSIAYCRIGERSSHTWFVLKYLLGQNDVKNYDGSWTEWGNLVGAPVETGEGVTAKPDNRCA